LKFYFKILTLLLFLLLANRIAKAGNCIPSGTTVTLTRQSEVDSFPINYPGCDVIEGGLIISGNDITNLDSLIGLNRIRYNLEIRDNPNLISLRGLDSIDFVSNFDIINNPSLLSLTGLNNLDSVYSFDFIGNNSIINLVGLDNLKYAYYFYITGNNSLVNFSGLSNLEKVGSTFLISNNNSLINFRGLNKLNFIWSLDVLNNSSLINFTGVESLSYLDNFHIENNAALINFVGMENVTTLYQHCYVNNNSSLENFIGLQNVTKFYSTLRVTGNSKILNFNGLNNVQYIGSFHATYNMSLFNFYGLNKLDTTSFIFEVTNNNSLKNFDGLQNLKRVGYALFFIDNNNSLCSINELNRNLILEDPNFSIRNNPKLNCCKIIDTILRNNPSLRSVDISNNATGCNDTTEIRTITTQNCCTTKYTYLKDTICQGDNVAFNHQLLTSTGTYYDTLTAANGMDSIIILQLKVYNKSYQIQNKNLCIGQSFTLSNGRVITTSGTYKDTIPNICDSIIEYRLNFLNNITVNQNASVCRGKTYTLPKGSVVTTSGIYRDTLRASFGCDSIIVTNLTVTNPVPFTNNVTICRGKTFTRPNGNIVSTTGIYYDTIKAPNNCDSIVITNLIVAPYLQSYQTVSTCLGKSFVLPGGRSVNQSGTYRDTIRNGNGCDSIITTNLTITNPVPFTNPVSICEGQFYTLPNGNKVNTSGIYKDTIRKPNTCDSIVITNLNVFPNNFTVSLNAIDTIESGSTITLLPIYTSGTAANWNWTPATNLSCSTCESPVASPIQTTLYVVNVKASDGCEDTAQTKIFVRQTNVYVPQAFSPNNDGVNDFAVVFANNPKSFSMKIYNRWGELVFESNDVNNPWNGTYKGADCPQDNYTYILDVTMQNGKYYHRQSSILLLR